MSVEIVYPTHLRDAISRRYGGVIEAPLLFDRLRYRETSPIPDGLRMLHHNARSPNTTFVFEQAPQFRLISYRQQDYYVPTPWVVYFLTMQDNRMWVDRIMFNGRPITSIDEPLWVPCLPNVYLDVVSYAKVCPNEGAKVRVVTKAQQLRLDLTIAGAIASFWASNFNDDITAYVGYQPFVSFGVTFDPTMGYGSGFCCWENLDPDTVLQLPWSQGYSIQAILNQMEWGESIGEGSPPDYVAMPAVQVLTHQLTVMALSDNPVEILDAEDPEAEEPDIDEDYDEDEDE